MQYNVIRLNISIFSPFTNHQSLPDILRKNNKHVLRRTLTDAASIQLKSTVSFFFSTIEGLGRHNGIHTYIYIYIIIYTRYSMIVKFTKGNCTTQIRKLDRDCFLPIVGA